MEIVRDACGGLFGVALILDTCKIKLQAIAYLIKTLIVQWKLWTFRLERLCPKLLWSFWDE